MWDRYRWQLEQRDWGVGHFGVGLCFCVQVNCDVSLWGSRTAGLPLGPRSCRYTHCGAAGRRCSSGDHHGSLQPLVQVNQPSSLLLAFSFSDRLTLERHHLAFFCFYVLDEDLLSQCYFFKRKYSITHCIEPFTNLLLILLAICREWRYLKRVPL